MHGFPYADGRYQHAWLDEYPARTAPATSSWQPHPNTGEDAPVGFAIGHRVGHGPRGMRRSSWCPPAGAAASVGGSPST